MSEKKTIEECMTPNPHSIERDQPLSVAHEIMREVARYMADRKIGSAVVVESAKIVGVFTTVDALRALADALS